MLTAGDVTRCCTRYCSSMHKTHKQRKNHSTPVSATLTGRKQQKTIQQDLVRQDLVRQDSISELDSTNELNDTKDKF
jgi:hypothetical protein